MPRTFATYTSHTLVVLLTSNLLISSYAAGGTASGLQDRPFQCLCVQSQQVTLGHDWSVL